MYEDYPQRLVFSHLSGFYSEDVILKISAPKGCSIYYTLDSTEPTMASICYSEPLILRNATENKNVYAEITDISTCDAYIPPEGLIDKCNVVRAIAVDKNGNTVDSLTQVYFVGLNEEEYTNVCVLSIVTDPANLFDGDRGIYVVGNPEMPNFMQRGRQWERPAFLSFFDENRTLISEKKIGVRIKGGATRLHAQKSFNLYARNDYDGEKFFQEEIMQLGYRPHKLSLMTGGNEPVAKVSDWYVNEISNRLKYSTTKVRPCIVFLEGEYWGYYILSEAQDDYYFGNHYGIDHSDIIVVKNGELEEGKEGEEERYFQMEQWIKTHDMSDMDNYRKACELIDIESYIDYCAMEVVITNADWLGNNWGAWRSRQSGLPDWEDGKWRWFLFDVNSAFGNADNTVLWMPDMFNSLGTNEEFALKWLQRLVDIANICITESNANGFLTIYDSRYGKIATKSFERWYAGNENYKEFNEVLNIIRRFCKNRRTAVLEIAHKYSMEKFGNQVSVDLIVKSPHYETVLANGLEINMAESGIWNAIYLEHQHLSLQVEETADEQFLGWKINGEEPLIKGRTLDITIEEPLILEAVFQEEPPNGE